MSRQWVALTGGIGSGKSTVGRLLAQHGALVVDADQVAREVVAPGTAGLAQVVAAFGPEVLTADGALDRARMAEVVFVDGGARRRLEAIIHPLVETETQRLFDQAAAAALLVYEIPLLAEFERRPEYRCVVLVDTPEAIRIERLVARGLTESEARRRMAAQLDREHALTLADEVIDNTGSDAELAGLVRDLVDRLGTVGGSG